MRLSDTERHQCERVIIPYVRRKTRVKRVSEILSYISMKRTQQTLLVRSSARETLSRAMQKILDTQQRIAATDALIANVWQLDQADISTPQQATFPATQPGEIPSLPASASIGYLICNRVSRRP